MADIPGHKTCRSKDPDTNHIGDQDAGRGERPDPTNQLTVGGSVIFYFLRHGNILSAH
jgi:hypothetical protein